MNTPETSSSSKRVLARPLYGQRMAVVAGLLSVVAGLVIGTTDESYVLPLVVVFGAVLVLVALWPLPVRIGSEGLVLSGFGRSRFVAFTEIDSIEDNANATVLRCADGRRINLFDSRQQKLDETVILELRALALRCWRGSRAAPKVPRRPAEPLAAWVESLRSALASDQDTANVRLRLFATLEDPGVPALTRGAAALLLHDYLTPGDRERIFALAGATASDDLGATLRLACGHGTTRADIIASLERLDPAQPSPLRLLSAEVVGELRAALMELLALARSLSPRTEHEAVTIQVARPARSAR